MYNSDSIFNELYNIFNNINNIIDIDIHNLDKYDIKKILKLDTDTIKLLLYNIIMIIKKNNIYSYKYSYYINVISFITNIICESYNNNKYIDLTYDNYLIINTITVIDKGHIFLKKIKHILVKYYNNIVIDNPKIILETAYKGTFPTFLFWWHYYTNIGNDFYLQLLNKSIINPDDRIYKFLFSLDNINNFKSPNNIKDTLVNLLSSPIPIKFKLKRIKLLSTKFDLKNLYKIMMCYKF